MKKVYPLLKKKLYNVLVKSKEEKLSTMQNNLGKNTKKSLISKIINKLSVHKPKRK